MQVNKSTFFGLYKFDCVNEGLNLITLILYKFTQKIISIQTYLKSSPPHKLGYYSFSQPMPSDPASSIFLSPPAFLSSAPPICPSSDYTPRQPDVDAHLTFQKVPTPDIILSDALSSMIFSTFHTSQSDTLSLPGGTGLDNTDRPLLKYN